MSKRQKFERVNFSFYFQPFKRHSFTFIRLSEADKTRKVYRELEKREHLCWDQVKKKRLLCWNKGEEEAVAGWQQQLAVGDRRRVSDWRMTVKVINIYIYIYIFVPSEFNFRLECPLFAGAAGIVQYCPVFRTWPGYFPKCSDCCEFCIL